MLRKATIFEYIKKVTNGESDIGPNTKSLNVVDLDGWDIEWTKPEKVLNRKPETESGDGKIDRRRKRRIPLEGQTLFNIEYLY